MPDQVGGSGDLPHWMSKRTVFVVWDMQPCIAGRGDGLEQVVTTISRVLAEARDRGLTVLYTRHIGRPWDEEDAAWRFIQARRTDGKLPDPVCTEADSGSQILTELEPRGSDSVVKKHRPSLFALTSVEARLRRDGVEVLVLMGIATDRGVLATAREAAIRGFLPIVVSDAVTSFKPEMHQWGMDELDKTALVVSATDLIAALPASARGKGAE